MLAKRRAVEQGDAELAARLQQEEMRQAVQERMKNTQRVDESDAEPEGSPAACEPRNPFPHLQ